MVRFVHTADWQIGMGRRFLDADAQARFSQARLDAVEAVGRLAEEVGAAFVTVAGDVFDDNRIDRRTLLRTLEVLGRVPAVPVWLLPGNHDPLDAGSVYRSADFTANCPAHVRVLEAAGPVEAADGVDVVAAPWRVKNPAQDPAEEALATLDADRSRLRVLVAHGACDALTPTVDQPRLLRLALLEEALADGRIGFAALGDRHSATAVGDTGRVWYAGAPEPTRYDETDPGKALVVDVDREHVEVSVRQVGRWAFREARFEVSGGADVERVLRWLDEPADKSRTIAKVSVRGQLALRDRARLEDALAEAAQSYAAIEQWQRHTELVVAPDDADLDALEVGGFARDAVEELRAVATAGGPDAEAASDALGLLYRLERRS